MVAKSWVESERTGACRRFNLGDAMILTAMAALAMRSNWQTYLEAIPTLVRFWTNIVGRMLGWWVYPLGPSQSADRVLVHSVATFAAGFLGFPLPALTLGSLCLRLRHPRPSWSTLLRQPGFAGNLATLVGFVLFLEANGLGIAWPIEPTIAGTILASWVGLGLFRRWRSEPGWIDRFGTGISCTWIITAVCSLIAVRV